jgi:maleate isomerase
MLHDDNWGDLARIGMFIVGNEVVPEAEWWAMLPPGVSVHAARVSARAPWAHWSVDRSGIDLTDDLIRGARQFADMSLSAVVVGHTSSSLLGGKGWDAATVASLSGLVGPDVFVTTNGLDTLAALQTLTVRRPLLVLPPWFNDDLAVAGQRYYRDHGIEPVSHLRYDPGAAWHGVPMAAFYARGMAIAQEIMPLYAQICAGCPDGADGVLIAGTGFRCVSILDALEHRLGRPVLSANQSSLWHCVRRAGVTTSIEGYGRLLRLSLPGSDVI